MKKSRLTFLLMAIISSMLVCSIVFAGEYPTKKIQVIVPYGAGGGTDTLARIVTSQLEKEMGQTIVVINKTGAKGEIGVTEIQNSKADGYHLGIMAFPDNVILSSYKETRYDLDKLIAIASFTADPTALSVKKGSPFKNLDELIAFAKKNPKKITVAVSGDTHVYSVAMLEKAAGIKVTTVYYTSGTNAMNAMLGGHVDAAFISLQWCLAALPQGCPILASAADSRTDNAPDVPVFKELGYDVEGVMARVLCAPVGTPADIIEKLTTLCDKIGKSDELKKKVTGTGAIFKYRSGKEMLEYFERSSNVIKNIVIENKDAFLRGA